MKQPNSTQSADICPKCRQLLMRSKVGVAVCINCGYSEGLNYTKAATMAPAAKPANVPVATPPPVSAPPPPAVVNAGTPPASTIQTLAPGSHEVPPRVAPVSVSAADMEALPPVPVPSVPVQVEEPAAARIIRTAEGLVPGKFKKPTEKQLKAAMEISQDFKDQYVGFWRDEKTLPIRIAVKYILCIMMIPVVGYFIYLVFSGI
jgi:hypothetical protein